jgi:hypothetical protein
LKKKQYRSIAATANAKDLQPSTFGIYNVMGKPGSKGETFEPRY